MYLKYLLITILTLISLTPESAQASIISGEINTTFNPAKTAYVSNWEMDVPYLLFSVSQNSGSPGQYSVTTQYDGLVGVAIYLTMPDVADLTLNRVSLAVLPVQTQASSTLPTGTTYYYLFLSADFGDTGALSLLFENGPTLDIQQLSLDTAVPEPGTVAFVGIGIGGILYRQRKRNA